MNKYEGMKELVKKVRSGTPVTKEELKKYDKFIEQLSLMLDEVPDLVGQGVLQLFWNEIHRINQIKELAR